MSVKSRTGSRTWTVFCYFLQLCEFLCLLMPYFIVYHDFKMLGWWFNLFIAQVVIKAMHQSGIKGPRRLPRLLVY